jgi:LemA protein
MILIGIIVVIIFFVIAFVGFYNKFIRLRNMVYEAWALIDVQLKLRYDVIPNLINTVKSYTQHEQNLMTEVTALRAKAMESTTPADKRVSENILTDKIANLMVAIENYPEIKSNEHYLKLQNQLFEIEEQIQLSRRYYNGAVRNFNIAVQSFPANLFASIFGFEKFNFFELESIRERQNLEISFHE